MAPANLRDLQKTVPLNAVARSVQDYLRNQGGVLPPQGTGPISPEAAPLLAPPRPAAGMPARQAFDTAIEASDSVDAHPPGPAAAGSPISHAKPIGTTPYPVGGGLAPLDQALPAPEEAPRGGWGAFGYLMVLLSLAAGVGVGFALFRFAPF